MSADRFSENDPRTIARDIPGILDSLFPQLVPGVVAHFNRRAVAVGSCSAVPQAVIDLSTLQRAMLFELAVAAGEQLITGVMTVDWDRSLDLAVARQRRHFDAEAPTRLEDGDISAAVAVARNLAVMIEHIRAESGEVVIRAPTVPGYQWIASGVGDFAVGSRLVEVKCSIRRFSTADFRQLLMYWLLGYAASLENDTPGWSEGILLNPRLNLLLKLPFNELIAVTAAGRSKVELLELFSSMVGDRAAQRI